MVVVGRGRMWLTIEDRVEIAVGVRAKETVTSIAERIGRDKSVISREIRRNRSASGQYRVATAHKLATARRERDR